VLVAALAFLAEQGPGRPTLDARLLPRFKGTVPIVLGLGAGFGGSIVSEQRPGDAVARIATAPSPEAEPVVVEAHVA
jgi:hypothetical protein